MYVDPKIAAHESIVIYDRDRQWRQFLARELKVLGFGLVSQTDNPKAALRAIRDNHADALITQHDLQLVKFLRNHRASPDKRIIIVLVTSNVGAEDILAERDAGVNEIVAKPASAGQVIDHLYGALTHPRRFIDTNRYHGPDRRRHMGGRHSPERRGRGQATVSENE